MLAQAELVSFILTTDAERARNFYVDILGLAFIADDPFAVTLRSGRNDVRLVRIKDFTPSPHTLLGWEVEDIEATVRQLAAAGVTFERYPYFEQDANGIWSASGRAAKIAWFKDPDGNVLSLSQHG